MIEFELPVPSLQFGICEYGWFLAWWIISCYEIPKHLESPADTDPTGEVGERGFVFGEVE